jgi:hypothetical protein
MWVEGDAVLLVVADIEKDEEAFNEWYDREHLPDRILGVPGYRVGRRYVAVDADPKYLALYQCNPGVFDSAAYRKLAEEPDARTLHFVTLMINSIRARTRVVECFGDGEGSVLGLVTFDAAAGDREGLQQLCARTLLPELARARGIVTGALLEPFPEVMRESGLPPLRRSGRKLGWILAIESGHAQQITDTVGTMRVLQRLAGQGAARCGLGTYRLTYRISP